MKTRLTVARCPACDSSRTNVVSTQLIADGRRIRRRHCVICDHRFYTEQPVETVLKPWQISWSREDGGKSQVRYVPNPAQP
jgi:transcriptional regulator NrdR family protein